MKKQTIVELRKGLSQIEHEPNEKGMKNAKQRKKDKAALHLADGWKKLNVKKK